MKKSIQKLAIALTLVFAFPAHATESLYESIEYQGEYLRVISDNTSVPQTPQYEAWVKTIDHSACTAGNQGQPSWEILNNEIYLNGFNVCGESPALGQLYPDLLPPEHRHQPSLFDNIQTHIGSWFRSKDENRALEKQRLEQERAKLPRIKATWLNGDIQAADRKAECWIKGYQVDKEHFVFTVKNGNVTHIKREANPEASSDKCEKLPNL